MITAMLALAAAQADPPPATQDEEILVVARRVQKMQLTLARDGEGRVLCGLSQSTGVNTIDERLCEIARGCAKKRSRPLTQVAQCVETKKPQLIAQMLRAAGIPKDRLNYHAVD